MGNPAHLTIVNSTNLGKSATWSSCDLWVLKNHPDTEPGSAHHYNALEPLDPLVDFTNMVDDEIIEEDDLIVYFNLGGHHVPTSQDVPNTLMHTSASSVMLLPFNYFDEDVSRAVRQGVRIDRRPESRTPKGVGQGTGLGRIENEEIRRSSARTEEKLDTAEKKDDEQVTYFGGHYTKSVLVTEEMLNPDLSHYMKERDDGEDRGWQDVRNKVGGGLYGLFVGKEREEGEEAGRIDW